MLLRGDRAGERGGVRERERLLMGLLLLRWFPRPLAWLREEDDSLGAIRPRLSSML
jgi:hypothetical protein